jgi:DNA-binding MarR family transcriptional regulator
VSASAGASVGVRGDPRAAGLAGDGARLADPASTLAVSHIEVLTAVFERPGTRTGQPARLLHMRPSTVTTIVNALTAEGTVCRAAADGDRRAIELTITGAGRHAVHAWQATNSAVLHLALSTLPGHQRRALAAAVPALGMLAGAIDRLADTTRPLAGKDYR